MLYANELMRYQRPTFQHPKGLLRFQGTAPHKRQLSIYERIKKQIIYFTESIHGCSYMWQKDSRFMVRLLWFFVVVGSIVLCIAMYMSLATLHNKQQIKTVVATSQMPIYEINFPAVALCPWHHVNWRRYAAAEKKFLPPQADQDTKAVFQYLLQALDKINLFDLDGLALLENHTVPQAIDQINLKDLAHFMAFRCGELLVDCIYAETKYDCCKIFVAEQTQHGICLVFNSMASEESRKKQITDHFYPWKNRKAGQGTGLQFTVRVSETDAKYQNLKTFGLSVMVKECEQWSESTASCFIPNSKTYLSIISVIRETSASTRHLDPRTRKCLFADEKSELYDRIEGLRFNKANCIVKCQQKNFVSICNCSLSWFFPNIDVRQCTVSDFKCIYANRDIFSYIKSPLQDQYIMDSRRGVTCDCVENCYSLNVQRSFHANRLPDSNASFSVIQGDIYIGQRVLTKYETRLYSTPFDLIAQFGGVLGLCLGASVLSLAEIVYTGLKVTALLLLTKRSPKQKIAPTAKGKRFKK